MLAWIQRFGSNCKLSGNQRELGELRVDEITEENQSPSEPLLIVSKLVSETVLQQNLKQINLSKPCQIVSNLKGDQPNSQAPRSSAYQN